MQMSAAVTIKDDWSSPVSGGAVLSAAGKLFANGRGLLGGISGDRENFPLFRTFQRVE